MKKYFLNSFLLNSFLLNSFLALTAVVVTTGLSSCSSKKPLYKIEYYKPSYRQSAPDPIYSRLMWSQVPEPVKPRTKSDAPLILPELFVELKDVNVDEAVEAVAQTMGYGWENSGAGSSGRISVHIEGTIEEIISEIGRKSNLSFNLDHERRMIKLADRKTQPTLPASRR